MADEIVGSAYVIIRAITNKIKDDIRDGVKKGAGDPALKTAGEDIGDTVGTEAGKRASSTIHKEIKERVDSDKDPLLNAGRKIGGLLGAEAGKRINGEIGSWLRGVQRDQRSPIVRAGIDIADGIGRNFTRLRGWLARSVDSAVKGFDAKKAGGNIGSNIGKGLGAAFNAIPPLPFGILVAGVPAIAGALKVVTSYVSSLIGLIGATGPAFAGMGAAGVAAYGALGQAMLVFKLAFDKNDKAAAASLKRMKTTLQAFKDELSKPVRNVLFPAFERDLEILTKSLLPTLKTGLTGTATVIAGIADKLTRLAQNPLFQRNLGRTMSNNNMLLGAFGKALVHIVSLLTTLLASARPVIRVFAQFIERITGTADAAAKAGQKTGALQAFFRRAADSMKQWGAILGNFSKALFNVFSIGGRESGTLVDGLQKLSEKFLAFTRSADGKNKIATYFRNGITIMREFNKLLADVARLFGSTLGNQGSTKGTVAFIEVVRTKFVPALATLATALAKNGPALTNLASAVGGVLDAMSKNGSLGAFTKTLTVLLHVVTTLLQQPFIGQIAGWVVAIMGITKALNLLTFGGFSKMLGPLGKFLGQTKLAQILLTNFRVALFVLKDAVFGLLRSLAGLVGEFLVAIGPIGWVVLAIAALVAAFVIAYKKSETFRNIVNGAFAAVKHAAEVAFHAVINAVKTAFDWVKDHWKLIAAILLGPIGIALGLIITYWDDIKNAFKTAIDFIVGVVKAGLAPILAIWKAVWGAFGPLIKASFGLVIALIKLSLAILFLIVAVAIRGIYETVKFIWGQIVSATKTAWGVLRAVIHGVLTAIRAVVGAGVAVVKAVVVGAWNVIRAATARVWRGLQRIIGAVWAVVGPVVRGAVEGIRNAITRAWNVVQSATTRVWNGLKRIIGPAITAALTVVTGIKDRIVNFFSDAGKWLFDAGKAIIQGLVDGIDKVKDKVEGAVKGVMKKARNLLPFSPAKEGPFSGRGWTTYSGQSIVEGLAQGIKSRAPHALAAVSGVMRGVHGQIGGAGSIAVSGLAANARAAGVPTYASTRYGASTTTSTSNRSLSITNNIYNPQRERAGQSVGSVLKQKAVEAGWVQ